MSQDPQEGLSSEADNVLLFQIHACVNPDCTILARVGDSGRSGKEKSGGEQLQNATKNN